MVNLEEATKAEPPKSTTVNDDQPQRLNIRHEDLLRGQTPADLADRCRALCANYIGGRWSEATADQLTITRVAGGLTNQLYRVQLNASQPSSPLSSKSANPFYQTEPTDVCVKLYESKHFRNFEPNEPERLNDTILLTIMSQTGIGPQVYGIFSDGVLMAHQPHEQFRVKHQKNAKQLRALAKVLAQIHHLTVPIRKQPMMLNTMRDMIDYGYQKLRAGEIAEELALPELCRQPLPDAFRELSRHIEAVGSPVVFCHNDFRGGNILVLPDDSLQVIDLEYCSYGPRGYDLGTVLTDYGKAAFFDQVDYVVPDERWIRQLAQYYVDACDQIVTGYASRPENSVEQVVREAKLFYLVQNMFFLSAMVKKEVSFLPTLPFDPITKMKQIENVFKRYNQIKQALIEDGTLKALE